MTGRCCHTRNALGASPRSGSETLIPDDRQTARPAGHCEKVFARMTQGERLSMPNFPVR